MLKGLTWLATLLEDISLNEELQDTTRWRFDTLGEYMASSAYILQFEGSVALDVAPILWDGWVLGKCRFFKWNATMNKILMADILHRRGWGNNYSDHFALGTLKLHYTCLRNAHGPIKSGARCLASSICLR
ncbi:hypothetical protein ACQ4PT_014594 [Festuca glaucescens]